MYIDTTFPPPPGRLASFARMIEAFERDEIETAVDLLIARLDARDGDTDLEDDDRAGVLMIAPAVDYDPDEDNDELDELPGDPVDAEEDDDAGGDVVDVPHDEETDCGADDEGEPGTWAEWEGESVSTHAYGDKDEDDGAEVRMIYRDRIRERRCGVEERRGPGWVHRRFYLRRSA